MSHKAADDLPWDERLTCTLNQACKATGLGRNTMYKLIASGQLESNLIAGRRLIIIRSLRKLVDPQGAPSSENTEIARQRDEADQNNHR